MKHNPENDTFVSESGVIFSKEFVEDALELPSIGNSIPDEMVTFLLAYSDKKEFKKGFLVDSSFADDFRAVHKAGY